MTPATTVKDRGYALRSVERVCAILALLGEEQGVGLNRVCEVTGLPKSSAFRYLAALEAQRFVERDHASGLYRFGPAFLFLRAASTDVLAERAGPLLEQLRDEFSETINLGVLEGSRVRYVLIVESPRAVRLVPRMDHEDYLHSTALGKAIAGELPREQVQALLEVDGMPACTSNTITDVDAYIKEIEKARRIGHAVDDRENESEGRCVAVAIKGMSIPAAISLSAPASRFSRAEIPRAAKALSEVARRLSAS